MDTSKFSDADLKAIVAEDWKNVSDSGLKLYHAMQPGSPESPYEAEVFPSQKERLKSGFADLEGVKKLLKPQFKNPKLNAAGELVVQDEQGTYYKDPSNLFPNKLVVGRDPLETAMLTAGTMHPLNWLTSSAGPALPVAGMAAPILAGPASPVAAAMLSGAGAGAGEAARQAIGQQMGVYNEPLQTAAASVGKEAAGGMAAEALSRPITQAAKGVAGLVGEIPLPFAGKTGLPSVGAAAEAAKNMLLKVPAYTTQLMTGGQVPASASIQAMLRPSQVRTATAKEAAEALQAEALSNVAERGKAVELSKGQLTKKYGRMPISTTGAWGRVGQYGLETLPSETGLSVVPRAESKAFIEEAQRELQRESAPPVWSTPVKSIIDYPERKIVPAVVSEKGVPAQYMEKPAEYERKAPLEDLLKYSEELSNRAKSTYGANQFTSPVSRTDKTINFGKQISGEIKKSAHTMVDEFGVPIPESRKYGMDDAAYSAAKTNMKLLAPVGKETTMESFVSNLFGKNKTAQQQAAYELAPVATKGPVSDVAARRAFLDEPAPKFGQVSVPWSLVRAGQGAGAGYVLGKGAGILSPELQKYAPLLAGAGAATTGLLGSPWLHYQAYTRAIPAAQKLTLPLTLQQQFQEGGELSPWSLLRGR